MHVKAFGVMTRHPVKAEQLPPDMRSEAPLDDRGRIERPSREFRAEVFRRFNEALEPLRVAGKLGGILFQFPPYVVPRESSLDYLAWAREQMDGYDMLVEFRHRAWYEEEQRDATLAFLEQHGMTVVVDAPKVEAKNVPITVLALTSPLTYVRFHGRNAETWNVRGKSAAARFGYLYSEEELEEWVDPLRGWRKAEQDVLFNSNNHSLWAAASWRRRRPTPRCCGNCSRSEAFPCRPPAGLAQQRVELNPAARDSASAWSGRRRQGDSWATRPRTRETSSTGK